MAHADASIPYFIEVRERALTAEEHALVEELVRRTLPQMASELLRLRVVGRCGCGRCPTVFFRSHRLEQDEREVASYAGKDASGGITGVVLWVAEGGPSQLELWSVDGHEPWFPPMIDSLEQL